MPYRYQYKVVSQRTVNNSSLHLISVDVTLSMNVLDHLRIDLLASVMHEMLFQRCTWPSRLGEYILLTDN